MFRLYSKGCEYTIRALMHLLPQQEDRYVGAKEICRRARIPEPFTRKMFQALVQKGLLRAVPGPRGGYQLACPPEKISVLRVIRAVEGEDAFDTCILGLPTCNNRNACPLHVTWSRAKRSLLPDLTATTLRDLVQKKSPRQHGDGKGNR